MMSDLAPLLQSFFTDKLDRQLNASSHTKAAYADAFRLLLLYAREATGVAPSDLTLADLNADLIGGFLQHLETSRGNSAATRNAVGRRCGRSSSTPATGHPTRSQRSARSLRSPRNARRQRLCPSSALPRLKLSSQPRTRAPGSGGVIGFCCIWPSRPGSESAKWSACASAASKSVRTVNSNASGRDASSA